MNILTISNITSNTNCEVVFGSLNDSTCYIYTDVSKVCSSGYTKISDSYCYK